jgi:hypothetical protein
MLICAFFRALFICIGGRFLYCILVLCIKFLIRVSDIKQIAMWDLILLELWWYIGLNLRLCFDILKVSSICQRFLYWDMISIGFRSLWLVMQVKMPSHFSCSLILSSLSSILEFSMVRYFL